MNEKELWEASAKQGDIAVMLSLDAEGNVTAHSMRRICCALVPKQARDNLICGEHGAVYGQGNHFASPVAERFGAVFERRQSRGS